MAARKKAIAAEGLITSLLHGPDSASVILRVTNPTMSTRTFCAYHTPFEGLRNDIFEVWGGDGVVVDYRGAMAKRAPPRADDFLEVPAGASIESRPVDLAEGYGLTKGSWTARFSGGAVSGLSSSPSLAIVVR